MGNSMAKVSAAPSPDPATDPGPALEKAMEPEQEALVVPPGGTDASSPGLLMEEFVMGDPARLVASMRLARELAASSRLFDLFASDAAFRDALARVRGGGGIAERLRVVAYGLGGAQYNWAPRFRLAVLLLLRDAFPDAVGEVEVVCPTATPVERRAMEELGCVVTASVQQCRPVREPTLIFMPYADCVFFENLLTLNWSVEQLGKIVFLGHSFSAMVKMLELSMSRQEKFGVSEQREKVRRVLAVQDYVYEIELCGEIDGLLDSPLWEDDSLDPFLKRDDHSEDSDSEECVCMYCSARRKRCDMISALANTFSVHLFHLDPEIDMKHLVPGNSTTVWSTVNVQMNYDAQLAGWHLNPIDAYIEDKDLKEAASIVNEVHQTMIDVRSSTLYTKFIDQLKEDPSIGDRISSMLGAHECMELVIYGIGSFEFNVKSQYQLAFALLLKEDEVFQIGDIEIYDPTLSPADVKALLDYKTIQDWLSKFIEEFKKKRLAWTDERLIGVSELKLEFLEVDDDTDIYSKLPRLKLKEQIYLNFRQEMGYNSFLAFDHVASLRVQLEERILRPFREDQSGYEDDDSPSWSHVFCQCLAAKNRTSWSPPPKGWIKLNFHGIGCSKGHPACIGGILHNDEGQVLSYYAGPVDVDQIVASAMALQCGLQNVIDLHEPVYKLIIEGDDLKVIRCCNGISSPPKRAHDSFSYIYWDMCLRLTKLPEECNNGKDGNGGSKDDDKNDRAKDKDGDDGDARGASSESVIPPGWARREFIAWHVEEAANLATGLARAGIYLPGFRRHNSSKCRCGHEMNSKSVKLDITWFRDALEDEDEEDVDEDLMK